MDKDALKRKVYITYKTRINTAERLKHTESFIQGLNIYYSLCLTAFSIYSISNSTTKLSLILTIASVMVTVSIVFLSTKRYGERSKGLKNNYIFLDQLYRRICDANDEELTNLSEEYTKLLNDSENHNKYDYYAAILNMRDENNTLSKKEKRLYNAANLFRILLGIILLSVPLLLKYIANIIEWIVIM